MTGKRREPDLEAERSRCADERAVLEARHRSDQSKIQAILSINDATLASADAYKSAAESAAEAMAKFKEVADRSMAVAAHVAGPHRAGERAGYPQGALKCSGAEVAPRGLLVLVAEVLQQLSRVDVVARPKCWPRGRLDEGFLRMRGDGGGCQSDHLRGPSRGSSDGLVLSAARNMQTQLDRGITGHPRYRGVEVG